MNGNSLVEVCRGRSGYEPGDASRRARHFQPRPCPVPGGTLSLKVTKVENFFAFENFCICFGKRVIAAGVPFLFRLLVTRLQKKNDLCLIILRFLYVACST